MDSSSSLPSSTNRTRFFRSSTTSATSTASINSPFSTNSNIGVPLQPQRVSSVDSLHHSHSHHALRKRHSTYTLSQSDRNNQQLPPLPDLPDLPHIPLNILHQQGLHRPPRNPTRSGTQMSDVLPLRKTTSSISRPSTASDAREEVTPWEFYAVPKHTESKDTEIERKGSIPAISSAPMKPASVAPSMKSHASSLGLSIHTGPIAEVTPWELYPAPPPPSNLSAVSTRTSVSIGSARSIQSTDVGGQAYVSRAHSTSISSMNIPNPFGTQRTGSSAQITRTLSGPGRSNAAEPGVSSGQPGTPALHDSSSPLPPLTPLHSANTFTGPIEDVTPWELEPGPSSALNPSPKAEAEQPQSDQSSTHKFLRLRSSVSSSSRPSNASKISIHQLPPSQPPPLPYSQLRQIPPSPQSPSRKSLSRSETPASHSSGVVNSSHWTHATQTPGSSTKPLPTGPAEEVTPWELFPVPVAPTREIRHTVQPRNSMSLTTAQLEDVTPWELYPVPGDPLDIESKIAGASKHTETGNIVKNKRSTRSSTTTSNVSKSIVDFGLRRRRSTGTKGRASTGTNSGSTGLGIAGGPGITGPSPLRATGSKGLSSVDLPGSPTRSAAPSSIVATSSMSSTIPPSLGFSGEGHGLIPLVPTSSMSSIPSSHADPDDPQNGLKSPPTSNTTRSSTTDRITLQELKANMKAREAHFVVKGIGAPVVGGGRCQGKRYHRYSSKDVPYPRAYEKEVLDLDVWEIMFGVDACQSYTWHVFETPPSKVLELGCGTGTWILQCAKQWKDTHFVGLDLVPLHPNLQNLESPDLANRIKWVQHNFLEGLPFHNEEFDFVHIKRVALGVPEDKWDALFEEIIRVMKPGGAFELIEEDLFFPGKPLSKSGGSSPVDDSTPLLELETMINDTMRKQANELSLPPPSPSSSSAKTAGTDTAPASPVRSRNSLRHLEDVGEEPWPAPPSSAYHSIAPSLAPSNTRAPSQQGSSRFPSGSKSTARPALSVKTPNQSGDILNGFGVSLSVFGVMAYQHDPMLESVLKQRGRSSSTMTGTSPNSASGLVSSGGALGDGGSSFHGKTRPSPNLLRTFNDSSAPNNPRDHTLLAAIWHKMLEGRFINLTPLSLLPATLEYHFKDVRTHPPLLCTFPPVYIKPKTSASKDDHHSDSEDDLDDARDALIPRPNRRSSARTSQLFADGQADTGVSLHGLLSHASPYVTLDDDRTVGISPIVQVNLPAIQAANDPSPLVAARPSVLPNKNLNIDIRTLNMHLRLRVKEILASSESMWEWIEEFQASQSSPKPVLRGPPSRASFRHHAGSSDSWPILSGDHELTINQILELTREDFDILLSNFELDMQDRIGMDESIEQRFGWHVFPTPEFQERKIFDTACEKYDKWVDQQTVEAASTPTANSRMPPSARIFTPAATPDTTTLGAGAGTIPPKPSVLEPPSYPSLDASEMLSRAMRVFVAWKPEN